MSERTTNACMWPEHVCMKGLCTALNNQFRTLVWHIYMTHKMINNPRRLVTSSVLMDPPSHTHTHTETHIPHNHLHSEDTCQTFSAVNIRPKECHVKV